MHLLAVSVSFHGDSSRFIINFILHANTMEWQEGGWRMEQGWDGKRFEVSNGT
jgi:hypothetical protein